METKQLRFLGLFMTVLLFFVHFASYAQVTITATGAYSQDFNTLSSSGSSNNFTNNSTISSWYIQREDGNVNPNKYAAGSGSSNSGGFYSFGTTVDRALGQVNSGSTDDIAVGLLLRNTSGVTITNITISYTLEQWRKAGDVTQGLAFSYKTSSSVITDLQPNTSSGWSSVSGLNLNGPISSGSDDIALNGNSPANRVAATNVSISGLSLVNGDYLMLRWLDVNHSGSDHGLAIDDVTVNYTVPSVIFSNDITTNNNTANPYTTNQAVDANATATGIGIGSGLTISTENGAYSATGWTTSGSLDSSDYFEFSVSPAVGYQLNFESFDYQGQRRGFLAPEDFSFRSSLSNYVTAIGSNYTSTNTSAHNRSIDLSSGTYQNVQSAITFRLYGYNSGIFLDEFGINNFTFFGTVTMIPPTVANTAPTAICDNASGQVTITGNNLIHVTSVTVGGTLVSIDSQSNTQLVVTVPQGVSGLVTVTNEAGSANGDTISLLNAITYYADLDGDGFGDAANTVSNCTGLPVGYVTNNTDCDDNLLLYEDLDSDGFGSLIFVACGGVTNNTDSNDNLVTYIDADGDGYGSSVFAPTGVILNGDCDDNNPAINPGAIEICYDGIDQNCDGSTTDGCSVITSRLRAENCDSSLSSLNQTVRGDRFSQSIPNGVTVTGYRFRVTNLLTNAVRIVDRSNYVFQLTYTDFAEYDTPYSVEVALRLNQEWMEVYGAPCTIVTPGVPNTVLASTSCGATLVQMNNIIRAEVVPSALNYEYNVAL
ncbi:MopE-related protein, partial [Flavobacterium sp.]|uniref:MopE-related protein n=1 Tax=Flavobacterium sp. TaxID=239 RepID=UPI00262116DB